MSQIPVPVDAKRTDWPRLVANGVNYCLKALSARQSFPFQSLDAEPASPTEGQTYYDTVMHKLRVYDGTGWQNAW